MTQYFVPKLDLKKNIVQHKIAKNLGPLPATVYNIVKRFRDSGEISVDKGYKHKNFEEAVECS